MEREEKVVLVVSFLYLWLLIIRVSHVYTLAGVYAFPGLGGC